MTGLMRRATGILKKEDEGVIAPIEFVMAFGIFSILLILFFSQLGVTFNQYTTPDTDLQKKAVDVSNILVMHTGYLANGSTNWEADPANVSYIGFARDLNYEGILSLSKINALNNSVPYAHAKECLGLGSPYDFCIQIVETRNDAPLLNYTTASFAFASSTAKFTQIVSIYDGINYLPARLTVYVF